MYLRRSWLYPVLLAVLTAMLYVAGAAAQSTPHSSITMAPPPLTLACPISNAQPFLPYSSALTASGGTPPYTFSISSGALPSGLTLNTSTGAIAGAPTGIGTFNFGATVTDSASNTVTVKCTITVFGPPLFLICPAGTGAVGVTYSSQLTAIAGLPPYTFSIASGFLPAGLTLNSSTGAITGIPITAGISSFKAKVTDSIGEQAIITCSIVIYSPLTLSCPAAVGALGVAYASQLTASGGAPPYRYSVAAGSLPPGLVLNTSTGAITGIPTSPGSYSFSATVTDAVAHTATVECTITIADGGPLVVCPSRFGQVGMAYSSALTAFGGESPYTFSITSGSLPAGLTLNTSTGAITGTPTAAGTSSFMAKATDSAGVSGASMTCSIAIAPALTLNGSAKLLTGTHGGTVLWLTPSQPNQAGSAFTNSPVMLNASYQFSVFFQFRMTGGMGGGDGMTFVLQTEGPTALGSSGASLGYAGPSGMPPGGIAPSVAVEFDTNQGTAGMNGNHVAILTGGQLNDLDPQTPYGVTNCSVPGTFGCMSNGDVWSVWIDYDGVNLIVALADKSAVRPPSLISYPIDLASVLGTNSVYVGFTAGTGRSYQNHYVLNFHL